MNFIITSGLAIVRKEFTVKRNTITYFAIVFSFIIVAFFLLAIVAPGRNAKADETLSDFYGDVYYGVSGQPPHEEWALYTKVTKGGQSSNWHYQIMNDHYNEYAEFGTGTYRIDAEHRIFSTQEVKATGWIEVDFNGNPVERDIITFPEKEY